MTPRKLATATLLSGLALTLAACGAGSSSHIVARLTPTTAGAPTSTTAVTVPAPGTSSVPGSAPVNGTPTTAPSASLNPQTLDQVAADLGALDNSLNTANSDLNNPQGDS